MRWGLGKKGYISCQSNVYFKSEQPEILVTTQMYALLFVLLKKGLGVLSRGSLKTPGVAWCLVIFNTELILMSMLTLVIWVWKRCVLVAFVLIVMPEGSKKFSWMTLLLKFLNKFISLPPRPSLPPSVLPVYMYSKTVIPFSYQVHSLFLLSLQCLERSEDREKKNKGKRICKDEGEMSEREETKSG